MGVGGAGKNRLTLYNIKLFFYINKKIHTLHTPDKKTVPKNNVLQPKSNGVGVV